MTKILVPFKYFIYENLQKIEKIAYYEDEFSHIYKICKGCLSVVDGRECNSTYCHACAKLDGSMDKVRDENLKILNDALDEEFKLQSQVYENLNNPSKNEAYMKSLPWWQRSAPRRRTIESMTKRQKITILLQAISDKADKEAKKTKAKKKKTKSNATTSKGRRGKDKVRKESKSVLSHDVLSRPKRKGKAKAGVV